MSTVLRVGPYRFFFFASDRGEPRHVHVEREANRAKFWLDPVRLQESGGFRGAELSRLASLVAERRERLRRRRMTTSATEFRRRAALAVSAAAADDALVVELDDGRTLSVPLAWYPRLLHGTPAERGHWRLIGRGEGIHWSDLDEDVSVEGLLAGRPSGESQRSLQRWLENRGQRGAPNETPQRPAGRRTRPPGDGCTPAAAERGCE